MVDIQWAYTQVLNTVYLRNWNKEKLVGRTVNLSLKLFEDSTITGHTCWQVLILPLHTQRIISQAEKNLILHLIV